MPPQKISELIRLLEEGTSDQRSNVMRSICPCRSHVLDKDIWKIVFQAAHQRGKRVRGGAVHAIATLLQRAKKSRRWRSLLRELSNELDQVLSDPEACKILRQGMQHDAEVAGGLTPAAHCRKLRRFVELTTPGELAEWLNDLLGQRPPGGVHPSHPGLIRLWRWQMHRITFQPERDTDPREFLRKAERWLPEFFRDANIELDRLIFDRPRQRENSVTPEQVLPRIEDDEETLLCLESSNPKRRAKGLKRLAQLKDPDLFDWGVMFLEDESKDVRLAALHAMIHCDEIDCSLLEPLAESEDAQIRAAATAALSRHSGPEAPRWFKRGLMDPSACVRLETAALLRILDRNSHRSLFEIALHDPNSCVVRLAQRSAA